MSAEGTTSRARPPAVLDPARVSEIRTGFAPAGVRLEADHLAHRYGVRRGLDPLSFDVAGPGVVAVTGRNGAGKSTLLRALAGLLRPSAGALRVRLDGAEWPREARRLRVGFLSPELTFYDERSAEENLRFAAEARGALDPSAAARAALLRAELEPRALARAAELSSGMRQRLRLAFALLLEPPLLLLDEPGSHLDREGRALVRRLIEAERARALVVIATNDEEEAALAGARIELGGRGLGGPA